MREDTAWRAGLSADQQKVVTILHSIFRNIDHVIEYLNRPGSDTDPTIIATVSQLVSALESVEHAERHEMQLAQRLSAIHVKYGHVEAELNEAIADEEKLKYRLALLTKCLNTGVISEIVRLETHINVLVARITAEV